MRISNLTIKEYINQLLTLAVSNDIENINIKYRYYTIDKKSRTAISIKNDTSWDIGEYKVDIYSLNDGLTLVSSSSYRIVD